MCIEFFIECNRNNYAYYCKIQLKRCSASPHTMSHHGCELPRVKPTSFAVMQIKERKIRPSSFGIPYMSFKNCVNNATGHFMFFFYLTRLHNARSEKGQPLLTNRHRITYSDIAVMTFWWGWGGWQEFGRGFINRHVLNVRQPPKRCRSGKN